MSCTVQQKWCGLQSQSWTSKGTEAKGVRGTMVQTWPNLEEVGLKSRVQPLICPTPKQQPNLANTACLAAMPQRASLTLPLTLYVSITRQL